jgi:hypothetical protein
MRVVIPAILMVGLFAASCGGSSPTPESAVQVPPAETGAPTDASPAAATPPAEAKPNLYKADLEAWCNAPSRAPGAATAADPSARARIIAEWISGQLQTDEAKELARRMGTLDVASRPIEFRKEVEGQGIKTCPFADEIAKPR